MQKWLFNFIFLFLFFSCTEKKTCKPFDLSHPLTSFHIFPDYKDTYIFEDIQNNTIEINKSDFIYDANESQTTCGLANGGCMCMVNLKSKYKNATHNINLGCDISYDNLGAVPIHGSNLYYTLGDYSITVAYDNDTIEKLQEEKAINLVKHNALTINSKTYENVFELSVPNISDTTPNVQTIWLKQNEGIVAFQIYGKRWTRK